MISPSRKDKVHIQPIRCQKPIKNFTEDLKITPKSSKSVTALKKISTSLLKEITKDHKETLLDKIYEYLDQDKERQNYMNYFLNPEETQIDSFLETEKKSELDWDYSNNSLVKIGDFSIKIDTIPNLIDDFSIKTYVEPNLLEIETCWV